MDEEISAVHEPFGQGGQDRTFRERPHDLPETARCAFGRDLCNQIIGSLRQLGFANTAGLKSVTPFSVVTTIRFL
jgi:hypothetical protein